MCLKKFLLFGLIAAVLPAVAEEAADRKTATSLKYVTHELDTRQNKFSADANKAMEYTDSAGTVQKRAVKSDLGSDTSDTSLPLVGGVNTKLNQKQDDIDPVNDHTAVTYTGQPGGIGQKGIYQTTESYAAQSNDLIDAKTFNAALKKGLDSEFLCSEYKPGTDLCWVWSIHNNETTNLIDWSQSVTYEVISSNVWTRYQVELPIPRGTWTCKHTSVPAGTYTVSFDRPKSVVTYVNGQARVHQMTGNTLTVTLNDAGEIWVFCATDSQMAAITQAQIVPGTSGEMLPYTTLVPAGYTPVEYVEVSSGTPIVQLGLSGNITFSFVAQSNRVQGASQVLLSSTGGADMGTWVGEAGATQTWGAGADNSAHTNIAPTTKVSGTVSFNSSGVTGTINGQSVIRNVNATQGTWSLFGATATPSYAFWGKVWSLRAYQNDALVGNFIPAKQGDTVGFYDTVTRTFKQSTGTGTLTAGPDINNIIYVPQNQ